MGQVYAGRYELVDVLGRGGMGDVWRVWDHRENRYCAAKVLRQSDSASLLRFVRESSTAVQHPHVLAPTGWVAEDGDVLLAMRIVEGGSLATLMGDFGALPEGWVKTLSAQLLDGLAAIHAAGLVHRDIKPANLLLEATGRQTPHLFVSDFGIATAVDEPRLTRADDVVHTPGYTAPQQLAGTDPEPRHDLYSVGVVMTEMLTGQRPGDIVTPPAGPFADVVAKLTTGQFESAAQARDEVLALPQSPDVDEPPEVFDHVPELPEPWGPAGHGTATVKTAANAAPTDRSERAPVPWLAIALAVGGAAMLLAAVILLVG